MSTAEHEVWLDADDDMLRALDGGRAAELRAWVECELEALPRPVRPSVRDKHSYRRRKLQLLSAFLAVQRGDVEVAETMALRAFAVHGPVAPVLRRLVEASGEDFAATVGRLALASDSCPDRDDVATIVDGVARVPAGWDAAVGAFAAAPSEETWDAAMSFVPVDLHYHRHRSLVRRAIELGVDPNVIFRCAVRDGATSDVIGLVQEGKVDVEIVEAYAGTSAAKGLWLGQAAEGALARGDQLGVVRLLRRAYEAPGEIGPEMSLLQIRDKADDDLNRMLDAAGLPKRAEAR